MKKLPIGIQTLSRIIEGDFVYVDKTEIALRLIQHGGGYYFLSRPRRFEPPAGHCNKSKTKSTTKNTCPPEGKYSLSE